MSRKTLDVPLEVYESGKIYSSMIINMYVNP